MNGGPPTDFAPTACWTNLRLRAQLLRRLRSFFDRRGFLEVETPLLSHDTVVDRHLDPLPVEVFADPRRPDARQTMWLQTSPEFGMKRLLAAGAEVVRVDTAAEMGIAVDRAAADADVVVMAAAVADFRPRDAAPEKIKKRDGVPTIELEPTEDILAGLGASRRGDQVIVGFAAETGDVAGHARAKLEAKNLDLIVANDVAAPGVGFEHDTNQVLIMSRSGSERNVALRDKRAVARAVLDEVVAHLPTR